MLDETVKANANCRTITKENGGPSSARNRGMDEASGDWLTFVDADDRLMPGAIEMMTATATAHAEADVIIFGIVYGGKDIRSGDVKPHAFTGDAVAALTADTISGDNVLNRYGVSLVSPVAKFFRRTTIVKHRLRFNESIHVAEDLLFCVHTYDVSRCVVTDPRPVYDYIYNSESITNTPSPRFRITAREAAIELEHFVNKRHRGDVMFRRALSRRVFAATEKYVSARVAQYMQNRDSMQACHRDIAQWLREPIVRNAMSQVSYADLPSMGYAGLHNRVKLFLIRQRLIALYILLLGMNGKRCKNSNVTATNKTR